MSTIDAPTLEHAAAGVSARTRIGRIASQIVTGGFLLMMTLSGLLFLLGARPAVEGIRHLGYPSYFPPLLGLAKLLGVVGILLPRMPRLREWAYAGLAFDLLAAIASHVIIGDRLAESVQPGFPLALLFASYFLQRRANQAVA